MGMYILFCIIMIISAVMGVILFNLGYNLAKDRKYKFRRFAKQQEQTQAEDFYLQLDQLMAYDGDMVTEHEKRD